MEHKVSIIDARGYGKDFHKEVCHFISVIVDAANEKNMRVGGYRGWIASDIKIGLISQPSETPWHIDAPEFTVYAESPFSALNELLKRVMDYE